MRMIAQAADVSPALVIHHFGDKDGLRSACNAHVTALFTVEDDGSAGTAPTIESIQAALNDLDAYGPALRYLARLLTTDDSGAAAELFDGILQGTLQGMQEQEQAGIIRPQSDQHGSALLLSLIGLAPLVLGRHFARACGEEELTPEVVARITVPLLELFTHGFYTDDSILTAAQSAMEHPSKE